MLKINSKLFMISKKFIDGNKISQEIIQKIKLDLLRIKNSVDKPRAVFINIGNNFSSEKYIKKKIEMAKFLNIDYEVIQFSPDIDESLIINKINELNLNSLIDGILVQIPLPNHINSSKIFNSISSNKDIDGLSTTSLGNLMQGEFNLKNKLGFLKNFIPCAASSVLEIIKRLNIKIKEKNVVIISRSTLIGKPIAMLLLEKKKKNHAIITIIHSKIKNLRKITTKADILITASGKTGLINETMVKKNSIIIDIGFNWIKKTINKTDKFFIRGDVQISKKLLLKVLKITPVPGGIGPITISMLMKNIVESYKRRIKALY
jgi:methylenetetrahydrofolate dehydrogenase (NADP+)/methenyltetrahydrofolate cyclohydrolase